MSFLVCRMQKMKVHDLKGIQFHNQRERESKTNPDIDKTKTSQNYDLVHDGKIDYNEHVKNIIESQKVGKRKTRKDAVLVNELLVTSDKHFFERLDLAEQKRFFEESFKLFSERYGKKNIAYATVHFDEKTPHMHVGIVPMRDGKLQGKNVFNRQELLWLQDKFPEHMRKLGFVLERGEKGSTREHIKTQDFKKQTLEKEVCLLEKNLKEKKSELLALNEKIPDEVNVSEEKEFIEVEVRSREKNLFGLSKKEMKKEPTGNVILSEDDFQKIMVAAKGNKQLKSKMQALLNTDLAKENKKLQSKNELIFSEWESESEKNKRLRAENQELRQENHVLKERISDLRYEIGLIYQGAKEFVKERTEGLKAFRTVFKDFVDKVIDRTRTAKSNKKDMLKRQKGEFEKVHSRELNKERDRDF